jgi:hypothetical protein
MIPTTTSIQVTASTRSSDDSKPVSRGSSVVSDLGGPDAEPERQLLGIDLEEDDVSHLEPEESTFHRIMAHR